MRRLVLAAVAAASAALLALAAALPAQAVGPFGPAVLIGPARCNDFQAATDPAGTTRGFMSCPNSAGSLRLTFVRGHGSTWSTVATPYGGTVLAVADDGATTYALYGNVVTGSVAVLRRTRSGVMSKVAVANGVTTHGATLDGAIVAAKGHFWASWSRLLVDGGDGPGVVFTYQDLTPSLPRRMPNLAGGRPSLALYRDRTIMVRTTDRRVSGGAIVHSVARDDGTWSHLKLSGTVGGVTPGGYAPHVARTGTVTRVTWSELNIPSTRLQKLVYADNSSGRWVRQVLPGSADTALSSRIEVSGSTLFVAWAGGGSTGPFVRVAQRKAGTWTTTQFDDGAPNPAFLDAGLAPGGKLTVFMARNASVGGPRITARTQT